MLPNLSNNCALFLPYGIAGNSGESYKVNDLNVEAEASGEEEDDIDWEEGWVSN